MAVHSSIGAQDTIDVSLDSSSANASGAKDAIALPERQVLATYSDYAGAQRAVDYLSDNQFPVHRVAIIGEGLHFVEQVTGRLTWSKALLQGAASGAVTGGFVGFLLGTLLFIDPLISLGLALLYGLVIGAVIGSVISAIAYGLSQGQRDFTSVGAMKAVQYKVMVDSELADSAASLLDSANLRTAS